MEPEEYALISAVENNHWWYKGLRNFVLKKLADRTDPNARILDAGCGTGGVLAAINRHFPGTKTVGIDYSPNAMVHANEKARGHVMLGNVEALPFSDSSFDVIISLDVIYHSSVDDEKAIREFMRVAKPGGLVLVHVPAYEWLRSDHDIVVHTARRYTAGKLRSRFGAAGFRAVECGYRNSLLFPAMAAQRLLNKVRRRHSPKSAVVHHQRVINTFLSTTLAVEGMLLRTGVRFPGGGSVFAIFKKANT